MESLLWGYKRASIAGNEKKLENLSVQGKSRKSSGLDRKDIDKAFQALKEEAIVSPVSVVNGNPPVKNNLNQTDSSHSLPAAICFLIQKALIHPVK